MRTCHQWVFKVKCSQWRLEGRCGWKINQCKSISYSTFEHDEWQENFSQTCKTLFQNRTQSCYSLNPCNTFPSQFRAFLRCKCIHNLECERFQWSFITNQMAVTKTQDYKWCFKKNVANTVLYLKKSFLFVNHINKIWKEERTFLITIK